MLDARGPGAASHEPRGGVRAARLAAAVMLACGLVLLPAEAPRACAFDMVKPERTLIDWIVEAETLVLARPREDNVFAFGITEVLAGSPGESEIGHLVDTASRRALAEAPDAAILFARDGDAPWRRIAHVDADWREVLEVALTARQDWRFGMPEDRIDYIAALQTDPDPARRRLAIAELDKVPYADLRRFDLRIAEEELLADLWTIEGYPYQAIRAVLLGLKGTPAARAEIVAYIDRVETWSSPANLGAFSAALIEIDGAAGVERLRGMLLDPATPLDKLEQLVMALSVHHELASPDLRLVIAAALGDLVATRPEAGVVIARQFTLRGDWSQSALLAPLVRARSLGSLADLLTVSVYVARAREEAEAPARPGRDG